MAEAAYGDARYGIQVAFALFVPEPCAFALFEHHRQSCVSRHYMTCHEWFPEKKQRAVAMTARKKKLEL
jgi:hypothetical protein